MNILQVSKSDVLGGAERIAAQLHEGYLRLGHNSWLAVGDRSGHLPDTIQIPTSSALLRLKNLLETSFPNASRNWLTQRIGDCLTNAGQFRRTILGRDSFQYPGTWKLPRLMPDPPDVIHCHNLHGSYFDLRALPAFAREFPMVVTMHDAWLLTGGCTHPLDCTRNRTGCGHCPYRDLYFRASILDSTAHNWRHKKRILQQASVHVITPSRWLLDQIADSILAPAVVTQRVIHNGVDLSLFQPGDRAKARENLGIDPKAFVVMHASHNPRQNRSKDYAGMRAAVEQAAQKSRGKLLFVVCGGSGPSETFAGGEIRFVPFLNRPQEIVRYYIAADIYLQGSRSDTFPNTVLEAMACGLPVVGTRVGGIPEQILDRGTGLLVGAGDVAEMADAITLLIQNPQMQASMGAAAVSRVRNHFDLQNQIREHLQFYGEIIAVHGRATCMAQSMAPPGSQRSFRGHVLVEDRCRGAGFGGISTYIEQIFAHWPRDCGLELEGFTSHRRCYRSRYTNSEPAIQEPLRLRPLRALFEQSAMPSDTGPMEEIFYQLYRASFAAQARLGGYVGSFQPNNLAVPVGIPTIATMHDLSVLDSPQWHPPSRVARWKRHLPSALRSTTQWITVSQFTRQRMVRVLGIDPQRIKVIYGAPRHETAVSINGAAPAPQIAGLPERFLLFVGNIEPRKNLLTLLDAYGMLPPSLRRETPLIILGRPGWGDESFWRMLLDHPMANEALVTGYVTEHWVVELMKRATALLMPSFYEGFSLPIVEAMAVGCPVICSDIEVHHEVAGDAVERVAPLETQAWADALNRAIEDESWRQSRRSVGIQRAKRFSWQQAANLHAQLIHDTVSGAARELH